MDVSLPPGQHKIDGFPRFGTHLGRPYPAVPADPVIEISGAVAEPIALPLAELATLGAPARLVSPSQYGYVSTKHLCRIELRTAEPTEIHAAHPISRLVLHGPLIKRHPRARVWEEERHPSVPARLLRPLYRLTIPFGVFLAARGSRRSDSR